MSNAEHRTKVYFEGLTDAERIDYMVEKWEANKHKVGVSGCIDPHGCDEDGPCGKCGHE